MSSQTIQISYTDLEERIGILREISQRAADENSSMKGNRPTSSGGGNCIAAIEEIADMCEQINEAYVQLVDATVAMLENANNSVVEADNAAANSIKNK